MIIDLNFNVDIRRYSTSATSGPKVGVTINLGRIPIMEREHAGVAQDRAVKLTVEEFAQALSELIEDKTREDSF